MSFEHALQQAIEGQLEPSAFLPGFVEGLESMLEGFEKSLEHQPPELVEAVSEHLEAISEGFGACRELALKALESKSPQSLLVSLQAAQAELNFRLLDFHDAVWAAQGPTEWPWANRIFRGAQRFFEGAPLHPALSLEADEKLRELEPRLHLAPDACGRALVEALRPVCDWLRQATQPERGELETMLNSLHRRVQEATEWLQRSQCQGLDQLIAMLEAGVEPEIALDALESAIAFVQALAVRFEFAADSQQAWGATRDAAEEIAELLAELESMLLSIGQELEEGVQEEDYAEPLIELRADLLAAMSELQRLAETEGKVPCPSCGQLNVRSLRTCPSCSFMLPALQGEDTHTIETSDQAQEQEPENVRRLKVACMEFSQGTRSLEDFQAEIERLLDILRQLQGGAKPKIEEGSELYQSALEDIGTALEILSEVEVPGDVSLEQGLSVFLRGSRRLTQLQES